MKIGFYKPLQEIWVKSDLNPDKQILGKTVRLRHKNGKPNEETIEVERVEGNRMLLRIQYSEKLPAGIKPNAFRITQEQIDAFAKDQNCELDIP